VLDVIAVTGATGHVGNALVRELLNRHYQIRAIVPPNEDTASLSDLNVEIYRADVRDLTALKEALTGVEGIFHLAGIISLTTDQSDLMHAVNVIGTKNIVNLALELGIKRLVYTSSVHAFSEPPQGVIITEETLIDPENVMGAYAKTKALATLAVEEGIKQGLNAVIVFPSGVIGPFDYKISEMGQLLLDYARGFFYYVDGKYDFVDVRDVVFGIIAAYEKAAKGERFILSGNLLPIKNILYTIQQVTKRRLKAFKIPYPLAHFASLFSPIFQNLSKKKPRFTSYSLYVLKSNSLLSYKKAEQVLGYKPRSFFDTAKDTIAWFTSQGLLRRPRFN